MATYYGKTNVDGILPNGERGNVQVANWQEIQNTNYDLQKKVGTLISNPTKRDIAGNLVGDFYNGKISYEDLESQINGSPTFNPNIGPQINYGSGPQSLTPEQSAALASGQNITQVANMPAPNQPYQPAVITSQASRDAYAQNQQTLQQAMQNLPQTQTGGGSYQVKSGDTLSQIAQSNGMTLAQLLDLNPSYKANPNMVQAGATLKLSGSGQPSGGSGSPNGQNSTGNGQPAPIINVKGSNAAEQAQIDQINAQLANGSTNPAIIAAVTEINRLNDERTAALNAGTKAGTNGDVAGVNTAASAVKDYEKKLTDQYAAMKAELAPLRAELATAQLGTQVQDVKKQLADFRNMAQASLDKTEGQAIAQPFIAGQQAEQRRQFSREEANIIAELGIEVEAQQALQDVISGKINSVIEDYSFQAAMSEKIEQKENDIIARADKLDAESRQKLADTLSMLQGVDPSKLTPQETAQLAQLAGSQGLDIGLVLKSLEASYASQVFENSIKQQTQNRLNNGSSGGGSSSGVSSGGSGTTGTIPPEFSTIADLAAGLVPSTKAKSTKANINNALSSGDYVGAYAEIANAVEEGLTGTPKTKFADARTDIGIMTNMRDAVQQFADAGGDMGLLKGTEESIKKKLGIDSGKASVLATQLWREFQTYRSNMTGAAFTPQESRDYASVNPTLGKSLDLNLSVIDGALNQLRNRVTSTVNARIPAAKGIYEKAMGGGSQNPSLSGMTTGAGSGGNIDLSGIDLSF